MVRLYQTLFWVMFWVLIASTAAYMQALLHCRYRQQSAISKHARGNSKRILIGPKDDVRIIPSMVEHG
jgi:hypothetical protein